MNHIFSWKGESQIRNHMYLRHGITIILNHVYLSRFILYARYWVHLRVHLMQVGGKWCVQLRNMHHIFNLSSAKSILNAINIIPLLAFNVKSICLFFNCCSIIHIKYGISISQILQLVFMFSCRALEISFSTQQMKFSYYDKTKNIEIGPFWIECTRDLNLKIFYYYSASSISNGHTIWSVCEIEERNTRFVQQNNELSKWFRSSWFRVSFYSQSSPNTGRFECTLPGCLKNKFVLEK